MAIPVMDIRDAIPEIGRVISEVLARGQQPTPPKQLAIRTVWSAVDHTRMYLRQIANGDVNARAPNPDLVALWSDASLRLAEFNPELALRLRDKADYWSDPQRWDEQQIDDSRIQIDAIAADARALLQLAMPKPPGTQMDPDGQTDVFVITPVKTRKRWRARWLPAHHARPHCLVRSVRANRG